MFVCLGSVHRCPVLKRAVRNLSGAHPPLERCILALALTHHTPAQPWAQLSRAPPPLQTHPISSWGLPSWPGPGPVAVAGDGWAVANSGHHPQPNPAHLAGGCRKGLVRDGWHHTTLAAPWLQPHPCSPTFPVGQGRRCRRRSFVAALRDIWAILEARRGFY